MNKFVDVIAGAIDNGYQVEVGIVLFNHSAKDFIVIAGDHVTQTILE